MKPVKSTTTAVLDILAVAFSVSLLLVTALAGCSTAAARTVSRTKQAAKGPAASQTTFTTPEQAGEALQNAARGADEQALAQILGPDAKEILSSGDPAEDQATLAEFVAKYDRMNRWVAMTDGARIIYIGADNYPYPIPLVQNASGAWYFNTGAGKDEILARRIGQNELAAIENVYILSDAERIYAHVTRETEAQRRYARLVLSTTGNHDGLYWQMKDGQMESPLARLDEVDDLVALAKPGASPCFDGYCYRILTAQGPNAEGGANNYIVNGKMTGGFAIIATPMNYGSTGIMTFIVNKAGVVYEQDLGAKTATLAAAITTYDPDDDWRPAQ